MKQLLIKYFKLIILFLLIVHLLFFIYRAFSYPFDNSADFFTKLFLSLALVLPRCILIALLGAIIISFVKTKIAKK